MDLGFELAEHYKTRRIEIERSVAELPADERPILLFGDSMSEGNPTQELARRRVVNQGISGDEIQHPAAGLLPRISLVKDAHPAIVFVLIGVNDLNNSGKSPQSISSDYKLLAAELNQIPDAAIVVQTCLPTAGDYVRLNNGILELNDSIRRIARENNFTLVDLHPLFRNDKGELKPELTYDNLHLNDAGYRVLNAELENVATHLLNPTNGSLQS